MTCAVVNQPLQQQPTHNAHHTFHPLHLAHPTFSSHLPCCCSPQLRQFLFKQPSDAWQVLPACEGQSERTRMAHEGTVDAGDRRGGEERQRGSGGDAEAMLSEESVALQMEDIITQQPLLKTSGVESASAI